MIFAKSFFALLIGRISHASDIRLKLTEERSPLWLFVNNDFSYNITSNGYHLRFRTDANKVFENLHDYFENVMLQH